MADANTKPVAAPLGQARIAGRIASTRVKNTQDGKLFLTLLKLPAPDQYSSPSTVEVRSPERLGKPDEEVSVLVNIGGYSRSYQVEGDDGKETVRTAENTLTVAAYA